MGEIFSQSIMKIVSLVLIFGLFAVGFSRPSESKLTSSLPKFEYDHYIEHSDLYYNLGLLVSSVIWKGLVCKPLLTGLVVPYLNLRSS